jgi:hypothetical protein
MSKTKVDEALENFRDALPDIPEWIVFIRHNGEFIGRVGDYPSLPHLAIDDVQAASATYSHGAHLLTVLEQLKQGNLQYSLDLQVSAAPTQPAVGGSGQINPCLREPRAHESLGCPQGQMIDILHRQSTGDSRIRILRLPAAFALLRRFPGIHILSRNPDRDAAALYQTGIVFAPIFDPIFDLPFRVLSLFLMFHPLTLTHIRLFMQQSRSDEQMELEINESCSRSCANTFDYF